MTLSFSQTINGKPNYFIEKIWFGLFKSNIVPDLMDCRDYRFAYNARFGKDWDEWDWPSEDIGMKLHTIRDYRKNGKTGLKADKQWKAGDKIHYCINNRSPNYFQFAPVIECKSVQTVEFNNRFGASSFEVVIDGKIFAQKHYGYDEDLNPKGLEQLAINDGFDSVEDFINYFSMGVERQLIHWTDLKY